MELEETLPVSQLPPAKPEASRPEHLVRQSRKAGRQAGTLFPGLQAQASLSPCTPRLPWASSSSSSCSGGPRSTHTHPRSLPPAGRRARYLPVSPRLLRPSLPLGWARPLPCRSRRRRRLLQQPRPTSPRRPRATTLAQDWQGNGARGFWGV